MLLHWNDSDRMVKAMAPAEPKVSNKMGVVIPLKRTGFYNPEERYPHDLESSLRSPRGKPEVEGLEGSNAQNKDKCSRVCCEHEYGDNFCN